jgi:hypothetical protein
MGRDYKRIAFGALTELYRCTGYAVGETEGLTAPLTEYLLLNYCSVHVDE